MFAQEGTNDVCYILMFAVDGVVHTPHVLVGDRARQRIKSDSHLGMILQQFLANDRDTFIGREVVAVVLENEQVERGNQAIGIVARDP